MREREKLRMRRIIMGSIINYYYYIYTILLELGIGSNQTHKIYTPYMCTKYYNVSCIRV